MRILRRGALRQQQTMQIHSSATKYDHKPSWYFQNGLRKVQPYLFEFSTFAKERWRGRSVIDVFSTDFRLATKLPLLQSTPHFSTLKTQNLHLG